MRTTISRMALEGVCSRVQRVLQYLWSDAEVRLELRDNWLYYVTLSTTINGETRRTVECVPEYVLDMRDDGFYEHLLRTLPDRHVRELVRTAQTHAARGVFR